jgi:hypothetical protein
VARLVGSTLWLLAGAATAAGLFWAFLNTPEATISALAVSALLFVLLFVVVAMSLAGTVLWWSRGWTSSLPRESLFGVPALVLPALAAAASWWLLGRATGWVVVHSGEISAWFIATLNWSDVHWLFAAVSWTGAWLSWVAVPFAALTWMASTLTGGVSSMLDPAWLRAALSPLRLSVATLVFGVLVALPWRYGAYWKPQGLPPTWAEPAFLAAKFGVLAVLGAVALTLIARQALPSRQRI